MRFEGRLEQNAQKKISKKILASNDPDRRLGSGCRLLVLRLVTFLEEKEDFRPRREPRRVPRREPRRFLHFCVGGTLGGLTKSVGQEAAYTGLILRRFRRIILVWQFPS